MNVIIGILIPFVGTCLGSLMVYFLKDKLNKNFEIIILGFASGVMIAASIWSLIIPSVEMSKGIIWLPACIGLTCGMMFFFLIDYILYKLNKKIKANNSVSKLMFAVTLHNIPEGMAVGVAFASYLAGNIGITLISCYVLSIGIAIQNFPEGAIISLPLKKSGKTKNKAFMYGVISAVFELLGAIITLLFTNIVSILLPYLLSFAAGAMLYVVICELIPESDSLNKLNSVGFMIGFLIMMILDITLG